MKNISRMILLPLALAGCLAATSASTARMLRTTVSAADSIRTSAPADTALATRPATPESPDPAVPDTLRPAGDSAAHPVAAFLRPRYLKRGDTVAIVSPAGRMALKTDTAKIRRRFEQWGLHVRYGAHYADRSQPYFAGTDAQRAADLQQIIDDPAVRAIIAFRGGYGSVRLLPRLDFSPLCRDPKWLVGFSDITTLHLVMRNLRIESIHGPMPAGFRFDDEEEDLSAESLREALFGLTQQIDTEPHPLNIPGCASGRLAGGNLTVLCAAIGTPEELRAEEPTVLFIEEVGEFVYRLDRMMQSLHRSGALRNVKAVVVGHLTDMMGQRKFGVEDAGEVLAEQLRPLGIPVLFGLPAGHEEPNLALYLGREVTVTVTPEGGNIRF